MDEKKITEMTSGEKEIKKKKTPWWLLLLLMAAIAGGLAYWQPWKVPAVPTDTPPETEQTGQPKTQESVDVGKSAADDTTEEKEPVTEKEPEQKHGPDMDPEKAEDGKTEDAGKEEKPEQPAQPTQPTQPTQPEPPAHTHTWVHHDAVTHTVHHDATYKTVHHDAVTEQKYVVDSPAVWGATYYCSCGYSTESSAEMTAHVLNAPWDEEHNDSVVEYIVSEEKGHYETVTVKDAWDETVVDQAAWDETIVDQAAYDECSGCGARK